MLGRALQRLPLQPSGCGLSGRPSSHPNAARVSSPAQYPAPAPAPRGPPPHIRACPGRRPPRGRPLPTTPTGRPPRPRRPRRRCRRRCPQTGRRRPRPRPSARPRRRWQAPPRRRGRRAAAAAAALLRRAPPPLPRRRRRRRVPPAAAAPRLALLPAAARPWRARGRGRRVGAASAWGDRPGGRGAGRGAAAGVRVRRLEVAGAGWGRAAAAGSGRWRGRRWAKWRGGARARHGGGAVGAPRARAPSPAQPGCAAGAVCACGAWRRRWRGPAADPAAGWGVGTEGGLRSAHARTGGAAAGAVEEAGPAWALECTAAPAAGRRSGAAAPTASGAAPGRHAICGARWRPRPIAAMAGGVPDPSSRAAAD
jgi:hypothetical protein